MPRVLIADGNQDVAAVVAALFKTWGHEVLVVHSAVKVLAEQTRFKPGIVLLDVDMCREYGVAAELRRMDEGKGETLIVGLTTWARPRDQGFDVVLVKPVESNVFAELIARRSSLLSQRKYRRGSSLEGDRVS